MVARNVGVEVEALGNLSCGHPGSSISNKEVDLASSGVSEGICDRTYRRIELNGVEVGQIRYGCGSDAEMGPA
ncbi:unannotated protein [freshwater metagenome]|uniref:Unannotated protein n=1 Tax=freshwater metagenome TaxID=449393 RepID=A0A6J7QAL1_9ZZZZ